MTSKGRGTSANLWRVSGVAARRFANLPYAHYVLPVPSRRLIVRVTLLSSLGWGGWRANAAGTAVCGLKGGIGRRRRLAVMAGWGALGLIGLAGWVVWVVIWTGIGLVWVPAVSFLCGVLLLARLAIRAVRVGRAKAGLPRMSDENGPIVEVHMVASEEPGAGRCLLEDVTAQADREGQTLVLDAANDRLAKYYTSLGFQPAGPPTPMPFGERVTRMVRRPPGRPAAQAFSEVPRHPLPVAWTPSDAPGAKVATRSSLRLALSRQGHMHRPRSRRHWPIAVLLCGAVNSGVLGTATQSEAGALKWSPVNIPTTFPNLLCPAPGFCVGVKERQKSYEVVGDALIGTYADGVWHQTDLPLKGLIPPAAASPEVQVTGLSCPAPGRCQMIGLYNVGHSTPESFISTLAGGKWTTQTVALDALSGANAPQTLPGAPGVRNVLFGGGPGLCTAAAVCAPAGVSCPTVSFCVAIGTYNAVGPGASGVLIETYQRGHWTASALPAKELDAAELAQLPITMDGVKCPKAGACVALGSIGGLGKPVHDIAIRLANGAWSFSEGPTVSSGAPYTPINGPGVMDCPAVGYCIFASGDRLMSFSDGNWTTYVAVEPMSPSADWQSLSCPVKGFCAAGSASPGTNYVGLLASGKLKVAPVPAGNFFGAVADVVCTARGTCIAVGVSGSTALVETLSGGAWTASAPPTTGLRPAPPTGRGAFVSLETISCPSPSTCLMVGDYGRVVGKSTLSYAFSEREEG